MLIESKSNLAKLMASENIIVEQKNVSTAYFNLGTRTLVLPTLKSELNSVLYDLFIGHEVGHALNTPIDGWHDSIKELGVNRSILNVCEDIRIEKLIRRKYPGLKMSFIKAYRELLDQDFFGVKGKNLDILKFIDRINLHAKCGASLGIKFNLEETPLLRLAENAETFEETVEVAKKIQDFMKEQLEERKAKAQKAEKTDEDESGEELDFDTDGESEEGGDDSSDYNDSEGQPTSSITQKVNDQELNSDTDDSFREKEQELFENNQRDESSIANIPIFDASKLIIDYKTLYENIRATSASLNANDKWEQLSIIDTGLFPAFRRSSSKVVSYLTKEFELRKNADQLKRAAISKTGDLNMSRIYSYNFNEDIFKKITNVPNGKSHGLVLFVDWSGSMHNYMLDTIKQLLSLILFCKKVQIPFEVYAFTDAYSDSDYGSKLNLNYKENDIVLNKMNLLNIASSRMNSAELSYAGSALLSSVWNSGAYNGLRLGGTPLNECIIAAMDIIPKFQKKYKLQVVNTTFLTDGEGSALNRVRDANGLAVRKYNIILRDPITSAYVKYTANANGGGNSKGYLTLLKQRTGCNVIGFRILTTRDLKGYLSDIYKYADVEPIVEEFRKQKSTVIKSSGFDEYYLLRAEKMSTNDDDEMEVKSTTTRGLVSAFKQYTKGHIQNRVILNRFIGLIS